MKWTIGISREHNTGYIGQHYGSFFNFTSLKYPYSNIENKIILFSLCLNKINEI